MQDIVLETHQGVEVLRDDLFPGGSKARFIPYLIEGAKEVVFGGPYCGGAPFALATIGARLGIKVTLFYAKRKRERWHKRQVAAEALGSKIVEVPAGYLTNVQAKARRYAEEVGARFLPLGFDVPEAAVPFRQVMAVVREAFFLKTGGLPDQVWCATGSGMLARNLGLAFPESQVFGVSVGLASRHDKQSYPPNVTLHQCSYDFGDECKSVAPFPCCPNYDRKAWERCRIASKGKVLFWNVAG